MAGDPFLCDRKFLSHKMLRKDCTAAVRKYVAEATRRRQRILRAGFFFLCRVFEKVGFVAYPASISEIRIR